MREGRKDVGLRGGGVNEIQLKSKECPTGHWAEKHEQQSQNLTEQTKQSKTIRRRMCTSREK